MLCDEAGRSGLLSQRSNQKWAGLAFAPCSGYAASVSRALALLVADPGTPADLIKQAKLLLGLAAGISEYISHGESVETSDENLSEMIGMNDFVVVLRSRPQASPKVETAVLAANQRHKPVYALTAPGVELGIDVQESRSLDSPDLGDWIEWIHRRHG
jgi:hypothetical protein